MTNASLAQSYLLKAWSRLKILQVLLDEGAYSDVVREAIRELVASRRKDKRFQQRLNATLKDQQRVLRQLKGDER